LSVSTYHLHARLLEGGLQAPTRDEVQSHESEDREEIVAIADRLSGRGFWVHVYVHDRRRGWLTSGEGALVVVAEWARGERLR
jgi:N6-adenosine-specific RNA methylase IME4